MRTLILEFAKKHEKPAYLAEVGDVVLLSVSGHCDAWNVCGVWVIDEKHAEEIRELVKEYHNERSKDGNCCEHCGMPASLQYQRFIVRTIFQSDLEQCQDLDIRVDEFYERLYTI